MSGPGSFPIVGALGTDQNPSLSPDQKRTLEINVDNGVKEKLAQARGTYPSVRQQTQSEVLSIDVLQRHMGANPFAVTRLPYAVMRDMLLDPDIGFANYYIKNPLISAPWMIQSQDAQLAAAVDAALRPVNSDLIEKFYGAVGTGCQPLVKKFKLEKLEAKYRDKNSSEPEKDREVWDSKNVDALVWDKFVVLPPENCVPYWSETGSMAGFMYSLVPLPNPQLVGVANMYGPPKLSSSYTIQEDYAMWITNEASENYNSIFGSPRTKRAYRFWWSFWYRWTLADRSFERKADPTLLVWYPTDVPEGIDQNDSNSENPTPLSLQERAIQTGKNVRSGSVVTLPGEFMTGEDGKTMSQRKWEMKYLEGGENFSLLDQNFQFLSNAKIKAMMLPTQAFVDSTVQGQDSSQRYIGAQMGQIYQESQSLMSAQYDDYINEQMIPQFIAANFPDKINVPIKRVTRGNATKDSETTKQLLTLMFQKNPEDMPIDKRAFLGELNLPLTTEAQQELEEKKKEERLKAMPPITAPTQKEGTNGYNAGVEKTQTGEHVYFNGPEQINLSITNPGFIDSLPDIPPYKDPVVRSVALKMRKLFSERYKNQISSFSQQIKDGTVIKLAEEETKEKSKPGLSAGAAKIAAAGAVAAWLSSQAVDFPAALAQTKEFLGRIVGAAGVKELKLANLDPQIFNPSSADKWVNEYAQQSLKFMDQTVKDQLREFLEQKLQQNSDRDFVAQEIEDHFSELPDTHAARAVRGQTRDAYNTGVLQAAHEAGIDQVMAHDASDGTNPKTDTKCILRDGKVFSPKDAMKETEHPNGTLWYSYLNTQNLSVVITDDIPQRLELSDRYPATYDDKTETLYIRERAKDSQAIYSLALSEKLRMR